jgi:hypothetical protein
MSHLQLSDARNTSPPVDSFRRVVEARLPAGSAARAGDTYGALLAGAHLLLSTAQVDEQ